MSERMDDATYAMTQHVLTGHASITATMLGDLDLGGFIRRADEAVSMGPIFQPTAWMAGHERVQALRDLAHAAQHYLAAIAKCKAIVAETEPRAERYRQETKRAAEMLGG